MNKLVSSSSSSVVSFLFNSFTCKLYFETFVSDRDKIILTVHESQRFYQKFYDILNGEVDFEPDLHATKV